MDSKNSRPLAIAGVMFFSLDLRHGSKSLVKGIET